MPQFPKIEPDTDNSKESAITLSKEDFKKFTMADHSEIVKSIVDNALNKCREAESDTQKNRYYYLFNCLVSITAIHKLGSINDIKEVNQRLTNKAVALREKHRNSS